MGLDELDGMDKPDHTGGRPPNTGDDDDDKREVDGTPYVPEHDTEEWWNVKFQEFKNKTDTIDDAMAALADHIYVSPRFIRIKLEEHSIYETDWHGYIDKYPMYKRDGLIRSNLIEAGVDVPAINQGGGSDQLFEDQTTDVSGGLSSMIDK